MTKGYVERVEMEEEVEKRVKAREPKKILEKAMEEAWQRSEMEDIKDKLSDVAKKHWKPQIEEALATTKYAEELKARAREIKYGKKVEEAWK